MSNSTLVVWDDVFSSYDFGPNHPMRPMRLERCAMKRSTSRGTTSASVRGGAQVRARNALVTRSFCSIVAGASPCRSLMYDRKPSRIV